jgi:hypothetical protein
MQSSSIPSSPPLAEMRVVQPAPAPALRIVQAILLVVAVVFLALHAVHLTADFPNRSFWKDWAKFTDEGWYGDAAIRLYQRGHWNVPGDFNPAAALPVWPALEVVLFRFTGVGLAAVRGLTVAVFGLTALCAYLLMRRWRTTDVDAGTPIPGGSLGPHLAVVLLAVSPFCYAFTHIAILEPLLILLTLLAMLAASARALARTASPTRIPPIVYPILLGVLLPLMVLTKTTAVFLYPAIFWLLWAATGYTPRPFLRAAVPACLTAAAGWSAYYLFFVRPHYLADYRYLFSANAYTGITLKTMFAVLGDTIFDGIWIGRLFYAVAIVAVLGSLLSLFTSRERHNPLPAALLLWVFGYAAFLAYHDNLQPRYYLVIAVPLVLLVSHVVEQLVAAAFAAQYSMPAAASPRLPADRAVLWVTAGIATALIATVIVRDAIQTLHYVRFPDYSFVTAAAQIRDTIDRERATDPSRSPLVLSISGSDLSLMTGLPSICDDFGTMSLQQRIATYRPGWYVTWNEVDDDKMEALAPAYRLERAGTFPAMDDPERNLLILYRLDPLSSAPTPLPKRSRSVQLPSHTQRTH